MLKQFKKYLPYMCELVKRDFKVKYKRSLLGILWSVLHPLMIMTVQAIVFSTLFKFDIDNFPMYLICGHVIFNFFNEATTMALSSVISNAPVISGIYVPCYVFPLSKVVSSLINAGFSVLALVIVLLATGTKPGIFIITFPIAILYTFLFSCGIGLVLSAGMVFFKDLAYLYGIAVTLIMYLTPVFYPESIIPAKYTPLLKLNPIAHFVRIFRGAILYNTPPCLQDNLICLGFCFVSLLAGITVFHKSHGKFMSRL